MSDPNKKFTANRANIRTQVVPTEIVGILSSEENPQVHANLLLWDFSEGGIGLWISDEVASGTRVLLSFAPPVSLNIKASIVWMESDKKGAFRCGLKVDPSDHPQMVLLEASFRKLKNQPPKAP